MTPSNMSIGEIPAELWHIDFAKRCQKDAGSALSAVLAYFPGQILSHDSSNQYCPKVVLDEFCELFPMVTFNL